MVFYRRRIFLLFSLFAFGGFLLSGCATVSESPGVMAEQDAVLKDLCVRYGVNCLVDSNSQVITLQGDYIQGKAMVGSAVVIVGENKVVLTNPVRLSQGVVYVPPDFKTKVFSLILKQVLPRAGAYKILIDPGHGGHDPGGIGSAGTKEKDVVLDIAKRLKTSLEQKGFAAELTRSTDVFLELGERARLANRKDISVFVSIHANIAKTHKVKGFEVYSLRPLDAKETREAIDPEKYRQAFSQYQMKKNNLALHKTLIDMLRSYKDYHSDRLAQFVAREVSSTLDLGNRGDKQAGFHVLKYTLVPAILIEAGFLSNPVEEKDLQSASYRQKIANEIAESLSRYLWTYMR